MDLDPEILKKLTDLFKTELEEQSQTIIHGLLEVEKKNLPEQKHEEIIATMFRAAHNIKGTSRGLAITDIGEIAHHLESLFSSLQKKITLTSPHLIDLCLEAVDKMRLAMQAFIDKTSSPFDLSELVARLEKELTENKSEIDTKAKTVIPQTIIQNEPPVDRRKYDEIRGHDTIRVSIENIERISALMEEMQVNKIAIDDHYSDLSKLVIKTKQFSECWKQILLFLNAYTAREGKENLQKLVSQGADNFGEVAILIGHLYKNMRSRIKELTLLSDSLQDETRTLRLVPAANLLAAMPRYVRDLSHELNKKVELVITGDDVKMDKMVLEKLKDPIIHLLRNGIDHGIESEDTRQSSGKSEIGLIAIDVKDENSFIHISITDDGAGIDTKKIMEQAEKKNFVSKLELEQMDEQEILALIFRPGFSSKEIITTVSGRGVGLDVVKSNVADLNGNVGVKSELGNGTTFDLCVPLTLASERGLMVTSCGQQFVLPTSAVQRVLVVSISDVLDVEGCQVIILDGHPLPLHTLTDILSLEQKELPTQDRLSIVVLKKGWNTVAVLVDEIIGEREIVIKPLYAPLTHISCVAGGTLSGSNQVIIVLNPMDLINTALRIDKVRRISIQDDGSKAIAKAHILVVDDSITTRTLEKNVLESKNYQVTVAVNGKEAWDLLQKQVFSLVITDVTMPIMDGFSLTEHVKQSKNLRDLPVIIVTSLDSEEEKKRGIDAGADAYIIKNEFESGALLEIVEQLL